jgi:hypothetical protein
MFKTIPFNYDPRPSYPPEWDYPDPEPEPRIGFIFEGDNGIEDYADREDFMKMFDLFAADCREFTVSLSYSES